ncbi:fibropellin-3-like [Branchiostoma floridae]|uniref:Fibropellin-3-like n=1 Tax=Branchiostoma floridae TaxID=7739 RepID=A0A9J7L6H7_BRAFL|nr:fibropellin-3-like [Branchiostoma floridae]
MWNKVTVSTLILLALGCGILMIASVITASVLATHLIHEKKNTFDSKMQAGMMVSKTPGPPSSMAFFNHSSSASLVAKYQPESADLFANTTETLPVTVTFLSTTDMIGCVQKPCQHGTCVNKDTGYSCICLPGWTGQNCQQGDLRKHSFTHSLTHSMLVSLFHSTALSMVLNLHSHLNECIWKPCQHGRCLNQDGGYKCTCDPGWIGRNCQQDINACMRNACQHGRCANQDGDYNCTCDPGWTGHNCQQDQNECTINPCQHGRCVNNDGSYRCICSPRWIGQNCQLDLNECTRKPCQHGRCVNQDGGYKCICDPGWTGQNCQQAKLCRRGWSGYKGHCYTLVTKADNWQNANSKCKQDGANLASITSREEANFINNIIVGAPVGNWGVHLVWFGLNRKDEKFRQFTDGSKVTYTNWEPGEPNNNCNIMSWFEGQECVGVYSKDGDAGLIFRVQVKRGQWNDDQCSRHYPFICKRPK